VITLIHGPAELLRTEALAQIRARIADDPALAELNTVVLDGRQASLSDLQFACEALPFLAERRLVVAEGMLRRVAPAKARAKAGAGSEAAAPEEAPPPDPPLQQALLAYIGTIPETTELVFVEDELLTAGATLRRITELQRDRQATVIVCAAPRKGDLPGWIRNRAKMRQVALDAAAIADLVEFVGDDLRQLDQELIKLGDYAAGGTKQPRTISRADVRRLVPETRAASVFDLVEALGTNNLAVAARLMAHALDVDGEQPLRLLALIGRQYRLILMARALQMQGSGPAEMAKQLGVPDWTVPKLLSQASRHSFEHLQGALEHILAADEAIKTGRFTDREAMDLLLAELAAG
jgi:DNA polymerase-3 subunit delta